MKFSSTHLQHHSRHPYRVKLEDATFTLRYEPGESRTKMYGGNSNWRGPVWLCSEYSSPRPGLLTPRLAFCSQLSTDAGHSETRPFPRRPCSGAAVARSHWQLHLERIGRGNQPACGVHLPESR